jgi:Fe-S-cluster containining protein
MKTDSTTLQLLEALHAEVDRSASRLFEIHRSRIRCGKGCSDCCIDDISVFEVEADRIRREAAELLAEGSPHPPGHCAFLSEDGACRIYHVRPYVCRTQGLPLRWTGETEDGSLSELRDICQLNEDGQPIEEISRRDCWTLGPFEDRLAGIQRSAEHGRATRVRLRDLFVHRA